MLSALECQTQRIRGMWNSELGRTCERQQEMDLEITTECYHSATRTACNPVWYLIFSYAFITRGFMGCTYFIYADKYF